MDILELLARFLNCDNLSDLHYQRIDRRQAEGIENLPEDSFTLEEFNRAARYIVGTAERYDTPKAAKRAIIQEMQRRP